MKQILKILQIILAVWLMGFLVTSFYDQLEQEERQEAWLYRGYEQ